MLTHCSQCKKTYTISIEELKTRSAELFCPHCDEMLGRLKIFKSSFFFSGEKNKNSYSLVWSLGFLASLALFSTQIYLVERDQLSQNPERRMWLEKICRPLRCHLPVYKNLDEFEILHSDFQFEDNHYVFQTVFSNQAEFKQHYPYIKLNLLDFSGQIVTERVFYPREYLKNVDANQLMAVSETIEVSLDIADPAQKVGGYTFELM